MSERGRDKWVLERNTEGGGGGYVVQSSPTLSLDFSLKHEKKRRLAMFSSIFVHSARTFTALSFSFVPFFAEQFTGTDMFR